MEDHPTLNQQCSQLRPTAVQAKRQYLLTLLSKQILPFAFEEQHSAVSAHFTSKQKLSFAIQEYSEPENHILIQKNTMGVLEKS